MTLKQKIPLWEGLCYRCTKSRDSHATDVLLAKCAAQFMLDWGTLLQMHLCQVIPIEHRMLLAKSSAQLCSLDTLSIRYPHRYILTPLPCVQMWWPWDGVKIAYHLLLHFDPTPLHKLIRTAGGVTTSTHGPTGSPVVPLSFHWCLCWCGLSVQFLVDMGATLEASLWTTDPSNSQCKPHMISGLH